MPDSTPTIRVPVTVRATHAWNGKRYAAATEVTIGRLVATASKAVAMRQATESATAFLADWDDPVVYSRGGYMTVCYPAPGCHGQGTAWCYLLVTPERAGRHAISSVASRDDSLRSARHHLAQLTVDSHDRSSVIDACSWIEEHGGTDDEQRTVIHDAAFQRAYRVADECGESDPHRWGAEHASEFYDRYPNEEATAA